MADIRFRSRQRDGAASMGPSAVADGRPWTLATTREGLKRQEKKAGLTAKGKWHRLRHTFCSHLAMRGAAATEIKELAGHQSAMALLEAPCKGIAKPPAAEPKLAKSWGE